MTKLYRLQAISYVKLVTFVYDSFRRRVRPDGVGAGAEGPSAGQCRKASGAMNRRDLVLAILAAADGRTYTPVQIQKAVFLICDQFPDLIDAGPGFDFRPYDYGPFDADVYSVIESLQAHGEAIIAPSPSGTWNTYAASDKGAERGESLLYSLDEKVWRYIERVSSWVRSLSFKSLVKSIYEAYPHMRENSIFKD